MPLWSVSAKMVDEAGVISVQMRDHDRVVRVDIKHEVLIGGSHLGSRAAVRAFEMNRDLIERRASAKYDSSAISSGRRSRSALVTASCSTVIPNSACRTLSMSTSEVSLALSYWRTCRPWPPPQALPVMPGKSPYPPSSRRCIFPQNWGWVQCASVWGGTRRGRRSSKW